MQRLAALRSGVATELRSVTQLHNLKKACTSVQAFVA